MIVKKCLSTILIVQEMQQLVGRLLWLLEASRKLGIYVGRDHVVISVLSNPFKNIGSLVSKLDGYSV
jgi:hypothetical protein